MRYLHSRIRNKHFLVLSGNGMLALTGFAISALLFHSMSMPEVGIWFFVQSIIAFCEAGRSGFLSTATVKFYAGAEQARARTVLGSVWYLGLLITVGAAMVNAGLLLFLSDTGNEELRLTLKWAGLIFLATLPSDVIFWKLQAEEKYSTMLLFSMVNSGLSALSFVGLIFLHTMTIEHALFFNFLTNMATGLIGMAAGFADIKSITHRTRACATELIHYGKYTLGTTIGSVMITNADTWIINIMLGPASVAIYNLAKRLMAVIELPLRSFAVTGMSAMAAAYNRGQVQLVTEIYKRYSGMLTIAFLPLAIIAILFGDIAIDMLGGAEYKLTEAANAYKLMMMIAIIYPIERLNGVTLDIIHQTRINFYKVVMMIVLKVVFDFVGILMFGNIYGVVLSIFVVHVTALVYGNYQLQKHLSYSIPGILSLGYAEVKLLLGNSFASILRSGR